MGQEQKRFAQSHQEYLESCRNVHGIELEVLKLQEEISKLEEKTAKLQRKSAVKQGELEAEKAAWTKNALEKQIVKHKVKQEVYKKSMGAAIDARESARAERQRKIDFLRAEGKRLEGEREWVLQQQEQVESYMSHIITKEEEEDRKIEDLGENVRIEIQKVRPSIFLVDNTSLFGSNLRGSPFHLSHAFL